MLKIIYNIIIIPLQFLLFYGMMPFHRKIRKGIAGRKNLFEMLDAEWRSYKKRTLKIWIHNSSLGEFEQARPLILKFKEQYPDCAVLITFFSPSGYNQVKDSDAADYITYLPFDSVANMRRLIQIVKPDLLLVIRHDFWPNMLWTAQKTGIPTALINCHLRESAYFRVPGFLSLIRRFYRVFDHVYFISDEVKQVCDKYKLIHSKQSITGDTKYDQVVQRARKAEKEANALKILKKNRKGFVVGSCWPEDEFIILPVLSRLKSEGHPIWTVLVPHEPGEVAVRKLEKDCQDAGLSSLKYSDFADKNVQKETDILIVDRIGLLASLYDLGAIAYVGGGFATGLHNVLEPAALGKAVLFGPLFNKFTEATGLVDEGVGIPVRNEDDLYEQLHLFFSDSETALSMGNKAETFVKKNVGATERIMEKMISLINEQEISNNQ